MVKLLSKTKGTKNINNIIGHNFRLGEIESAIGIEQFKKLDKLLETRQKAAEFFKYRTNLKGLKTTLCRGRQ